FSEWGKETDGAATPWAEWYDVPKLLRQLLPFRFHVLMAFDDGDLNWFDLMRTDGDPGFDEIRPDHYEKVIGAVDATKLASDPQSGASVRTEGSSRVVQTPQGRWADAATVPINDALLPVGPGWLAIDIAVEHGVVGVSVRDRAAGQILAERQFGEG